MTGMDDLVIWLRAQFDARERELAEDERVAREALHPDAVNPGVWITEHHNSATHSEPNRCHIAEDKGGHYWSVAHEVFIPNAEHIARWDPARVLREVVDGRADIDAKRRILDLHPTVPEDWAVEIAGDCRTCSEPQPCQTLGALALPMAGRDGYRSEWAP